MTYLLLLVDAEGAAITAQLALRQLREFPGDAGLSVHFRPVRNDLLFESAKIAGALAYRILSGEGIVRSQLWVEYEVLGPHVNVSGRSSDLLFSLALITSKWKKSAGRYPAIAATGSLDADGATVNMERSAAVQGVKHTVAKVAAAVRALSNEPAAMVFYPAADAESVSNWRSQADLPPQVTLHPVRSLEDALSALGITLERVYLGNPYRGLEPFEYAHRAIFFGRDREVRELLCQLLRRESAGAPGVLVEGASGSGKSSFLRAGLLPTLINPDAQQGEVAEALQSRPIPPSASRAIWRAGLLARRADEPGLVQSIHACWQALPELTGRLREGSQTLADLAHARRECWPPGRRFVWLLDQLEELFALELMVSVIEDFGQFLIDLQSDGVWTLASIRADAVPQLKQHPSLRQVFGANEGEYYLGTITATALDEVINRPAAAAALSFGMDGSARRLDQILMEDAHLDRENALPLLQFTLHELYQRRCGKELTYAAYQELGGLAGSVATTADAVVEADLAESHRALQRLFRSLVTVDEAGGVFRRHAPMDEIAQDPAQKRLLQRLVQARLCVTDQREGEPMVAFAHEALLRTWPVLMDWLKQEAGLLQVRELAQREARLWQQHGHAEDWLAGADKLVGFRELETAGIALSGPVRTFIERSSRRVRRSSRIKQAAVGMIALLAIAASVAGWTASRKQHEAEAQARETLKAQSRLLTQAAAQRLKDSDVAAAQGIILEVLTNDAFAHEHTPSAIGVFQKIRASDAQLAVFSNLVFSNTRSVSYSPDGSRILTTAAHGHAARVLDASTGAQLLLLSGAGTDARSAAFSPDGARIVTGSPDKVARVWDANTGSQLAVLAGHGGDVLSASYSPDGSRIATSGFDGTARIWDSRTGVQLAVLPVPGGAIFSAAYSPDGARIVTASDDKTARIWDARTGAPLMVLTGHTDGVLTAVFSPDGTRILTASEDKSARIWDARTGVQLKLLSGHQDIVYSAVYSGDGTRIVTASVDKTARIWDARTGLQLGSLSGHRGVVNSAAFSPDGSRIVTASFDDTVRVWNASPLGQLRVLSGHEAPVGCAAYSPDGARIVTASNDRSARVWDARTGAPLGVLTGHQSFVFAAAFSPDGEHIVTASGDKTARIWDARSGAQLALLAGHGKELTSAAYAPDGSRVVTASIDSTARVWDARSGMQLMVLAGHLGPVNSAAYSPDGSRIVTASMDKTARIWDARTGAQIAALSGHDDELTSAAYSADGERVVTASKDKSARIWDARTGVQLAILSGHDSYLTSAAFSPDGVRIVTGSADRTARIWDAQSGTQLAALAGHGDIVDSVVYSPDGKRILTASEDRGAWIWDARVAADIAAQIRWYSAAQVDPIAAVDRTDLGLPESHAPAWPEQQSACDREAGAYYDPRRHAPGASQGSIAADIARAACEVEIARPGHGARAEFQLGRALLAKRQLDVAKRQFELAVSQDYPAARVDLANFLLNNLTAEPDLELAIALYEKAWQEGVAIAAFRLGALYENGVRSADAAAPVLLVPDLKKAWSWYEKGARLGQPHAVARFAERDESDAAAQRDATQRQGLMLDALVRYASAVQRAEDEQWPDYVWTIWRYHRATLARLLASEGMMQLVADAIIRVRPDGLPATTRAGAIRAGAIE